MRRVRTAYLFGGPHAGDRRDVAEGVESLDLTDTSAAEPRTALYYLRWVRFEGEVFAIGYPHIPAQRRRVLPLEEVVALAAEQERARHAG